MGCILRKLDRSVWVVVIRSVNPLNCFNPHPLYNSMPVVPSKLQELKEVGLMKSVH